MPHISTEFIAIGCNRTAHAADWSASGLVAFGADKLIALYSPLDPSSRGIRETLRGHTNRVICVEFLEKDATGENAAIISGSADTTAKIWKKNANGQWINSATLEGHNGAVEAVATCHAQSAAQDMDLLVTGSADGKIRIWERRIKDELTDDVVCVQTLDCGNKYPLALALSHFPNSDVPILACGHTDKNISIYAYQQSKEQFELVHALQGHDNWVRSLAFATFTGQDAQTATTHTLKPGDLMLASASQDKYIRLWKISPYESDSTPTSKEQAPTSDNGLAEALQANSLSGEKLSTKAHLVDIDNKTNSTLKNQYSLMFEALLIGHDDWVTSVTWAHSRMGDNGIEQPLRLISSSSDKSMMIWKPDADSGVWVNEVRMGDVGGSTYLGFCGAMFSSDGKHVLAHGANGSFHLWKDVSTSQGSHWKPQVSIGGHFESVENLAWDPQGRYLISVSLDQTSRLFAPWRHDGYETWHEMGRPQIHGYDLKSLAFVSDWKFVSGADEKVLRVFDAPKSCVQHLAALTGEKGLLDAVESRPAGANVPALGLSNKAVFESGGPNAEDNDDQTDLQSYTRTSMTATTVKAEDITHPPFEEELLEHTLWPEMEKLYGHGYEIVSVGASHDGKYIATSCKASTPEHAVIRLFDTSTWKEVKSKIHVHSLTVTRVRFSHNDQWLLTVSRDRFWSLSKRVDGNPDTAYELVAKNKAHARIIWDCSWSHDDKLFVTGSRDKTLKIWAQVNDAWTCVATVKCDEAITAVDFAPRLQDGRYILAAGLEDGRLKLMSALPEQVDSWQEWCHVDDRLCHVGVVRSLAWRITPLDQLQLASAGQDHSVRVLNALP